MNTQEMINTLNKQLELLKTLRFTSNDVKAIDRQIDNIHKQLSALNENSCLPGNEIWSKYVSLY